MGRSVALTTYTFLALILSVGRAIPLSTYMPAWNVMGQPLTYLYIGGVFPKEGVRIC
jgi:hypothetical protein